MIMPSSPTCVVWTVVRTCGLARGWLAWLSNVIVIVVDPV